MASDSQGIANQVKMLETEIQNHVAQGQFARDVLDGLSAEPRKLSSKYFYDAEGDRLFQKIMHLPEYYLTRAELEIFTIHKEQILAIIQPKDPFRLIELGPGDGLKTRVLLRHFQSRQANFSYVPVDISSNSLSGLITSLEREIPGLETMPLAGDYFEVLAGLKFKEELRNVVFFLGSNIGNFLGDTVTAFLRSIQQNLRSGDLLMIGFDLKKDPKRILSAYNDASGVTRDFNLNLLRRINDELGGNFITDRFMHHPVYNPVTGECRSYLISKVEQEVFIEKLDRTFRFGAWEPIFMEVSKKYSIREIETLAVQTGFRVVENLFDSDRLFTDAIWEVL